RVGAFGVAAADRVVALAERGDQVAQGLEPEHQAAAEPDDDRRRGGECRGEQHPAQRPGWQRAPGQHAGEHQPRKGGDERAERELSLEGEESTHVATRADRMPVQLAFSPYCWSRRYSALRDRPRSLAASLTLPSVR